LQSWFTGLQNLQSLKFKNMARFNILSLESGKIRKTIQAKNYTEAVEKASEFFNCYLFDEYFIETVNETEKHRQKQSRCFKLRLP